MTTLPSSQYRDAVMLAISDYDITDHMEFRLADHIEDDRQRGVSITESIAKRKAWLDKRMEKQAKYN
jgi:hypothetical protein